MPAKKYYAYFIPETGRHGIAESWSECEKIVSGEVGARYRGFKTREEAEEWLARGAGYGTKTVRPNLEQGIYFDAGTGRGEGVEISVTDEKGSDLLKEILEKKFINRHGKHLIPGNVTNNYGELLACKYALELALKKKIKKIFGDSMLILKYWSRGVIKKTPQALPLLAVRREIPKETINLAHTVTELRKKFEKAGGILKYIPGDDNPADLGFHR